MKSTVLSLDLQGWASLATVLGVAFAIFTLALGYMQYRSSIRAASLSHVNGLFRDLLRLEFDFYNAPNPNHDDRVSARSRLAAYKMWVLEELWLWLKLKKSERPITAGARAAHTRFIENWTDTLDYHARRNSEDDWNNFKAARLCYDATFYTHVSSLRPTEETRPNATG